MNLLHSCRLQALPLKAQMSLYFEKIPSVTLELSALERLSAFIFDQIFYILVGNKETYNTLDGFEILQDPTRDL